MLILVVSATSGKDRLNVSILHDRYGGGELGRSAGFNFGFLRTGSAEVDIPSSVELVVFELISFLGVVLVEGLDPRGQLVRYQDLFNSG